MTASYNWGMPELGFSTYVFVERIAANAAALHPFPEHNIALVRDQLTEYVLESDVNPLPYVSVLDGVRVMEAIR